MNDKWELIENGYRRRQRLVSFPSGLVIGYTNGSTHDGEGWDAMLDGPAKRKWIGTFVTEDLAKNAVEKAQPKKRSSK
jgi:hypothetical protein